jgi:hypothetical protein
MYPPHLYQADAYLMLGRIDDAKRTLQSYAAIAGGDPRIEVREKLLPVWEMIAQRKYNEALAQLEQLMQTEGAGDRFLQREVQRLMLDLRLLLQRTRAT